MYVALKSISHQIIEIQKNGKCIIIEIMRCLIFDDTKFARPPPQFGKVFWVGFGPFQLSKHPDEALWKTMSSHFCSKPENQTVGSVWSPKPVLLPSLTKVCLSKVLVSFCLWEVVVFAKTWACLPFLNRFTGFSWSVKRFCEGLDQYFVLLKWLPFLFWIALWI